MDKELDMDVLAIRYSLVELITVLDDESILELATILDMVLGDCDCDCEDCCDANCEEPIAEPAKAPVTEPAKKANPSIMDIFKDDEVVAEKEEVVAEKEAPQPERKVGSFAEAMQAHREQAEQAQENVSLEDVFGSIKENPTLQAIEKKVDDSFKAATDFLGDLIKKLED